MKASIDGVELGNITAMLENIQPAIVGALYDINTGAVEFLPVPPAK